MPDINMFGVTYMQQINEANQPAAGLHVEPGIWANVPQTSDPTEPPSVVRMASIPHGTVINAQGVWQVLDGGPQHIPGRRDPGYGEESQQRPAASPSGLAPGGRA